MSARICWHKEEFTAEDAEKNKGRTPMKNTPWIAATAFLCILCGEVSASSPSLGGVSPRGGQRGTDLELTLGGNNLSDAQEVLFYSPGIAVTKLTVVNNTQVKVAVKIGPECRLGEHPLPLRSETP